MCTQNRAEKFTFLTLGIDNDLNMNIAIDLGNTSAKAALFEGKQLSVFYDQLAIKKLPDMVNHLQPEHVIIGSVNQDPAVILNEVDHAIPYLVLSENTALPIKINYDTPNTLGADRIAATVGAYMQSPNTNSLIIDMGTCITYEFLDEENVYHGGAIAPGLHMKFKALNNFTTNLPLITAYDTHSPLIGSSTKGSVISGVINGTIAEIHGIIRMYSEKYKNLRVIMCGGDAKFFENKINTPIFVTPELVLVGLNGILQHNV